MTTGPGLNIRIESKVLDNSQHDIALGEFVSKVVRFASSKLSTVRKHVDRNELPFMNHYYVPLMHTLL